MVSALRLLHLSLLCAWAGVVAVEGILELLPARQPELRPPAVRFHYWIDLLVELPLVVGVVASGLALAISLWPLTATHAAKLACVSVPIAANLFCIAKVLDRYRALSNGAEAQELEARTRRILSSAVVGLPLALAGAGLGLWLAAQRLTGH